MNDSAVATYHLLTEIETLRFTQFMIDRISDTVYWIDKDARIFYVNDAACRSLNYSREVLLSMTVYDIDPDYTPERWAVDWTQLKENGFLTIESHHRDNDGRIFPVEISLNYMVYDGREFNCAFARDISKRKQAEKEKEQLIAELQKPLGNVKKLSGLLPICSSCKKIRDDQGYWNQLEVFIHKHSEADFSHGLCPECAQRLYPGFIDEHGHIRNPLEKRSISSNQEPFPKTGTR